MARVLVVGESWFVHSVHQKGIDSFFTSAYEGRDLFDKLITWLAAS